MWLSVGLSVEWTEVQSQSAFSKLGQFHSRHVARCLLEETLKTVGPIYLVAMPGEVKDPTQGVNM